MAMVADCSTLITPCISYGSRNELEGIMGLMVAVSGRGHTATNVAIK